MVGGGLAGFCAALAAAQTTRPNLKTADDRDMDDTDHGEWLAPGEHALYTWETPVTLAGCRIVFDTLPDIYDKRMLKLEAVQTPKPMPPMLPRKIRLEARIHGTWHRLLDENDLHTRLLRRTWNPVTADAVRLSVDSVWGEAPGQKAHIYTLELR